MMGSYGEMYEENGARVTNRKNRNFFCRISITNFKSQETNEF